MWYCLTVQRLTAPAPLSRDFLRGVERYQADLNDTDVATAQTVQVMAAQAHKAARDPLVKRAAVDAVKQWRGGPLYGMSGRDPFASPQAMAESCWWYAKHHVRFVHHNELIAAWFDEHDQLQLLISPEILVRLRKMEGDCAIYTMLLCAMLESLGLGWEIVTAAVNPREPDVFSHVWARALLPDGRRVPLDASHGDYPGWQVPAGRQYKRQVWNSNGRPVADRAQFSGLHGYSRIGRGMGDPCFPGDADYNPDLCTGLTPVAPTGDTSSTVDLSQLYPIGAATQQPTVGSPSAGGGFNTGAFLANLANQWTQIGSRVLAPSTTYVRNADGSVSLVTPGSSPVLSSSVLSGGGGITGSTLLWIGGGLAALFVVGSMMSKH